MITPFTPAGTIDESAVARIVEHLVSNKIGGIFPLGTTGGSVSIHPLEKRKLVEAVVKSTSGRATVYAGISGNCFRESVEAASDFKAIGAQAVVAHVPTYYPLSEPDVEAYFLKLADRIALPLVLYNIPQTTHHTIALDVIDRLRSHPNIVAIKDSANDPPRIAELLKRTGGRGGWPVLVGNSPQFTAGLKLGAIGIVPSGAQLVPDLYQQMFDSAMADKWDDVERLQRDTDAACAQYNKGRPLGEGLAVLKALLEKKGLCGRTMAPPLRDHLGQV